MDKIINVLHSKSKLLTIVFLLAAAGVSLIVDAAGFPNGFMPVVGSLLHLLLDVIIWGIVPVLFLLKKDSLAKCALIPIASFWLIQSIYSGLDSSFVVTDGYSGLTIAAGLFAFFFGLTILAAVVLGILYAFTRKRMLMQVAFAVVAGGIVFALVAWALRLAVNAKFDADWTDYLDVFLQYIFLPLGFWFATFYYVYDTVVDGVTPSAKAHQIAEDGSSVAQQSDEEQDSAPDADMDKQDALQSPDDKSDNSSDK